MIVENCITLKSARAAAAACEEFGTQVAYVPTSVETDEEALRAAQKYATEIGMPVAVVLKFPALVTPGD